MLLTGAHSFLKPSPPSLSPSLLFLFVPIPHLPFLPRQNQGTAGGGSVVPCTKAHTTLWARDVCKEEKDGGGRILDIRAPSPTVHYTQAYTMPGKSVKKAFSICPAEAGPLTNTS